MVGPDKAAAPSYDELLEGLEGLVDYTFRAGPTGAYCCGCNAYVKPYKGERHEAMEHYDGCSVAKARELVARVRGK